MSSSNTPWEPDPRGMGNWRAMFDGPRGCGPSPAARQPDPPAQDEALAPDLTAYRPWLLQRGRPAMMLGLRRFDPRGGHWIGWGLSYHNLFAVEYIGDRMLSLDFGMRQFVLEGRGLDELARHIKHGTVTAVLEYAPSLWPQPVEGPVVTSIKRPPDACPP